MHNDFTTHPMEGLAPQLIRENDLKVPDDCDNLETPSLEDMHSDMIFMKSDIAQLIARVDSLRMIQGQLIEGCMDMAEQVVLLTRGKNGR